MPEIAFIMGKSSSGKDSIFRMLADDKELGLCKVVPYTTRPMRSGETQGVEYNFVDDAQADRMAAEGRIIELRSYNTVHGIWRYFTADDGQIELGNGSRYIIIGTLEAYKKFLGYFGEEHIMPIYIEVDDGIRRGSAGSRLLIMRRCAEGLLLTAMIFQKRILPGAILIRDIATMQR